MYPGCCQGGFQIISIHIEVGSGVVAPDTDRLSIKILNSHFHGFCALFKIFNLPCKF